VQGLFGLDKLQALSAEEQALVEKFRKTDERGQQTILDVAKAQGIEVGG
jgi:hypothetical protein